MRYYIYKITNTVNNKHYIGLTNNIERRRKRHFYDLRTGVHDNKFLQSEYDKYGLKNFVFIGLESLEYNHTIISQKEKEYIVLYDSYHNGYNQNEGGNFGPSNGGSKFIKKDIFNILAVDEFHENSRAGGALAKIYDTTLTTMYRIRNAQSHIEYYSLYYKLEQSQRKEIYNLVVKEFDFDLIYSETSKLASKRKLSEEQVHLILANEEFNITTKAALSRWFNVRSNTIHTILNGKSYKDYSLSYKNVTKQRKIQLVSLLSNQ